MSRGAVFIPGIFGGIPPPPKKTAAKLCALNLHFCPDNGLHIYHGNVLLMDNKHMKLLVIKQSKGCILCLQCTKIRLTAGLRPDPLRELMRSPTSQPQWGPTSNQMERRKGRRGPTYKGRGKRAIPGGTEGKAERTERGEANPPKSR